MERSKEFVDIARNSEQSLSKAFCKKPDFVPEVDCITVIALSGKQKQVSTRIFSNRKKPCGNVILQFFVNG